MSNISIAIEPAPSLHASPVRRRKQNLEFLSPRPNSIDFYLSSDESKESLFDDEITNAAVVSNARPDLASFGNWYVRGWLVIVASGLYCVVGLLALFNVRPFYWDIQSDFPVENYYAYVLYLCPTIFWCWCIVSWVGMKLFRHAKGIAIEK